MALIIPNILVDGSPIYASLFNQNFAAVAAAVNGPQAATSLGLFAVKDYGAKGDGVTDDTAAIQVAIAAAQANGGGIVWFTPGTFVISSAITVTGSHVGLQGAGLNSTVLQQKTTNGSGLSFAGSSGAPLNNVFASGLSVNATGAATGAIGASTSNTGLSCSYIGLSRFDNLGFSGFYTGVSLMRATNTVLSRILASFNPSVATTANAKGFYLNGANGGNVSSILRDCISDFSPIGAYSLVNVGSTGFYISGAYSGDLFLDTCATSYAYTSYYIDFSGVTPNAGGNGDVHFHNCTGDAYTYAGVTMTSISAAPIDNLSMVNIIGGWFSPYSGASTPYGVYLVNARGVLVKNAQFMTATPTGAAAQYGVYVATCSNVMVEGCHFVGQRYGIVPNGSTDMQITGNRFYSASGSPNTLFINVASGQRIGIANNTFDGYSVGGAVQFDNASSYCTALGNTIHQANIANPAIIPNSGTGHQIANNVIS